MTGNSKAGNVKADGARIEGNIVSEKAADILKDCVVIGDITASSTFIAGAVKGNIDVKGPVVIDSTAVIIGDIKSQTLQINSGATIDGRCTQCYSEINTAQIFEKKKKLLMIICRRQWLKRNHSLSRNREISMMFLIILQPVRCHQVQILRMSM